MANEAIQRLDPHSPEWFDVLFRTDPMLAKHIRQIVDDAGRADVCSICGGDHVADFQLKTSRPITLKLCAYCRDLYRGTYGENLSPLGIK